MFNALFFFYFIEIPTITSDNKVINFIVTDAAAPCVVDSLVCVLGPDVDVGCCVDSVGDSVVSSSQLSVTFFIIVKMCLILDASCRSKLTSAVFNSFTIASPDNTELFLKYLTSCNEMTSGLIHNLKYL